MRCFILPAAHKEIGTSKNHLDHFDRTILWHPEAVPKVLQGLDAREKTMYTDTELTAGIVDSLITMMLCCVLIVYVFIRWRLSFSWMKLLLVFPITGAVADILWTAGITDLLSTYPNDSAFRLTWIRGFGALKRIAYIVLGAGLVYVFGRNFYLLRYGVRKSVNSN